ncbi:MAG: FAD-dependent oxidoreductase [Coriobacteriia bacterium]
MKDLTTSINSGMDRRSFLKGAVATGATAALATALAGCGTKSASVASSVIPATWDNEYDVVIVGGGAGGLCAAIEAATAGSSVVVLEFESTHLFSGTALSGGWVTAAGTSVQKAKGIDASVEEHKKYLKAVAQGLDNPDLSNLYAEQAGPCVERLTGLGVKWDDLALMGAENSYKDQAVPAPHSHHAEGAGKGLMEVIYQAAVKAGAKVEFNTTAESLFRNPDTGRVVGVKTDKGTFGAKKGVVIAAAGWTRNQAWFSSFTPVMALAGRSYGSSRQQGDGIRMGMAVGAKIGDMWMTIATVLGAQVSAKSVDMITVGFRGTPCIFVNANGVRWIPEDMYYEWASKALSEQPGGFAWLIWDETAARAPMYAGKHNTLIDAVVSEDWSVELEKGYVFKANTVAELAALIKVDPATLVKTLDNYNAMILAGKDTEFGRTIGWKPEAGVKKAPFYAAKMLPTTPDTAGGLVVNTDMQVLDPFDKVIPGLYAAGTNAAGWHGYMYAGCGSAAGWACVSGMVAGKKIATETAA